MAAKEYLLLLRDVGQVIQIILLFTLSVLYLYNLETLAFATRFSQKFDSSWTRFMVVTTISIGCFFIVAICTRLVFPSISLEGSCFSYYQTSPLQIQKMLRIKFWLWFIPLALLAAAFFTLAAYSIQLSGTMILAVALFGILTAYVAVGFAIGLGARFAEFDWEYSTQLAASFGSVFYMLVTVATLSSISISLVFFSIAEHSKSLTSFYLLIAIALGIALIPASTLVRYTIKLGLRKLTSIGVK
jgi:ABC-2 type transport system permease protein